MIKIKDLTKKFEKTISLDHVTLDFSKGDAVALMGAFLYQV
jgi:ABC-type multidrug transport system ATPase subunit